MATLDEVARFEDEFARALEEYTEFRNSSDGYHVTAASEPNDPLPGARRKLVVTELRFERDELLRRRVEVAEAKLNSAKREFILGALPELGGRHA